MMTIAKVRRQITSVQITRSMLRSVLRALQRCTDHAGAQINVCGCVCVRVWVCVFVDSVDVCVSVGVSVCVCYVCVQMFNLVHTS
jgi:hypothetical protein